MTSPRPWLRWLCGALLLLAGSLGSPGVAQASWSEQTSVLPAVIIYGTTCPTSTHCLQITEAGVPQTTTNGGATWTLRTDNLAGTIRGVDCPTTTICYATATVGDIYKSTDFGVSWALSFDGTPAMYGIDCLSELICYAVGGGTGVRWTTNGGTSWTLGGPNGSLLYGVSCPSADVCYAYGAAGDTYKKAADNTWSLVSTSAARPDMHATAYGMSCPSVDVCYMGATAGEISKTTNGGSTWTILNTVSTPDIYAMSCVSETRCLFVGVANQSTYTDDGGATLTTYSSFNSPAAMYSIAWAGTSTAIAGNAVGNTFVFQGPQPPNASLAVSETLTAGTLSFIDGTPAAVNFPSIPLASSDQTVTAAQPLVVADATGSGNGWSISVTSTTFTTGSRTLSNNATTVQSAPTIACKAATTCTPATNSVSYPFTLPAAGTAPTAQKLFSAAVNTGLGAQTVTPTWRLAIPATTYAGTYTSTWTFTLMSGP